MIKCHLIEQRERERERERERDSLSQAQRDTKLTIMQADLLVDLKCLTYNDHISGGWSGRETDPFVL